MDRETVITHLQIIHTWAEFARERDLQFFTAKHLEDIAQWADDAIAMLKKQEEHKFFVDESGNITPLPVVVRCKDCVFGKREKNDSTGMTWIYCGHHRENRPEDWFCASGSRI